MFAIAPDPARALAVYGARSSLAGRARHHAVLHQFRDYSITEQNGSRPACCRSCFRSPPSSMCGSAALVFGAPIDRRVVLGGLLGRVRRRRDVLSAICRHHAQSRRADRAGIERDGTFSFCFGNMISLRLQRRGMPIFAATGYGMIYGATALALFAAWRGHAFIIEPTAHYVVSLRLSGADRIGAGVHLLSHIAGPDRRRPRGLFDGAVPGGRAGGLDHRRGLSAGRCPRRSDWPPRLPASCWCCARPRLVRSIPPPARPLPKYCRARR